MPSERDHVSLAEHNQEVIDFLLTSTDRFGDWITIVAFYKALHLVEALFARDHPIVHGRDHQTRARVLKEERRYGHIYSHYRALKEASSIARYLGDHGGRSYKRFTDYLSAEAVRTQILGHRLHQLERSVRKLLSKPMQKKRKKK